MSETHQSHRQIRFSHCFVFDAQFQVEVDYKVVCLKHSNKQLQWKVTTFTRVMYYEANKKESDFWWASYNVCCFELINSWIRNQNLNFSVAFKSFGLNYLHHWFISKLPNVFNNKYLRFKLSVHWNDASLAHHL